MLPMPPTRRQLISAASAALLLQGCKGQGSLVLDSDSGGTETGDTGGDDCPDLVAGGKLLDLVPFQDGSLPLEERLESGLDGRYAIDLELLGVEANPLIDNERFFIRTFAPQDVDAWPGLKVNGELTELPTAQDIGPVLMECSGNGSNRSFGLISAATWAGTPVLELIDADYIEVEGMDEHGGSTSSSTQGCSWVFTRAQLQDAVLASQMNGAPLPTDHGAPIRLIVPGWFGCTCIKWVTALKGVDAQTPATSQMKEFASRTHQSAAHALAADYAPAQIQHAAMPVRVEKWEIEGESVYLVWGILWGGTSATDALQIKLDEGWEDVTFCPAVNTSRTWTVWQHLWRPSGSGQVEIVLRVDADVPQVRLDQRYYARSVVIS